MPVRTIAESDIPAATMLIGQLGYEMPQAELTRRLTAVLAHSDHRVWVYDDGGKAVGLLHAFFRPALDKPPEVMVQALVIEASQRSRGVGEALMQVAESWAREKGCTSVALYSRVDRDRAHRFYERLGMRRSWRRCSSGRSGADSAIPLSCRPGQANRPRERGSVGAEPGPIRRAACETTGGSDLREFGDLSHVL